MPEEPFAPRERRSEQTKLDADGPEREGEEDHHDGGRSGCERIADIHRRADEHKEQDFGGKPQLAELFAQPPRDGRRALLPQHAGHAHHGQQAGDRNGPLEPCFRGEKQECRAEDQKDLYAAADRVRAGEGGFKKGRDYPARRRAQRDAEHDGEGNAEKVGGVRSAALRHTDEGGKEDDHENVVAGRAGENKLRNAFVRSPAVFHQLHHARHDDGGRDRAEHRAHRGGFDARHAEKGGRKEKERQYLTACRHAGEQHRAPPHAPEVGGVQRQSGLEQNDDERDLPQLGGDGEKGGVQQIQGIRSQQNAREQEAENARQAEPLAQGGRRETEKKNERERGEHKKTS